MPAISIHGFLSLLPLFLGAAPLAGQEAPGGTPSQRTSDPVHAHMIGPGPLHKVLLRRTAESAAPLRALQASGAIRSVHEHGSDLLLVVDDRPLGGRAALARSGLEVRDEWNVVILNGNFLDGTRPQELLSGLDPAERIGTGGAGRSRRLDPRAGLYLVQFVGPVRDEWTDALDALGATFRQYQPMNAYVVGLPPDRVGSLEALADSTAAIQFIGVYEPAFRMSRAVQQMVRAAREPVPVTVQLVGGAAAEAARNEVASLATGPVESWSVGSYVNVRATVHPGFLRTLAFHPAVFAIEERGELRRLDERQGQTVAGNVSGASPTGPGYLAWLASRGFGAGQFTSFSVNVVDDAYFLTGHPDIPSSRVDFALNPSSQSGSVGGHGFLNAHIVGGFNDSTGSAFEDAAGYQYGLGIAPWALVGVTAIFGSGSAIPTNYENSAYAQGARISTNSWGYCIPPLCLPITEYDSNSQEFDTIVRDARPSTGGNQEYTVVFSAGNDGSGSNTVSTPGTAKNIITVGASENNRPTGTDGCGVANSGANDIRQIISFSSRGPVDSAGGDGRFKPEIVAPGTHVQAGVPQSSYNGSSVCDQYWPSGQTLYGWSSGTSHSCPAVAGGAALVRQWFLNEGLAVPSPAMVKAVLTSSAEYLTGTGAGGTLPSNSQGFGLMHLERAFGAAQRILVDQTELLASTGASYVVSGSVSDTGEPFRVTLAWTDPPGSTTGGPWVNDLDLTVDVGGSTYLGNVFSGASSTPGGSADFRNNLESVFRPAGASGTFTVTVDASTIAGDGVPGNGDSTDQDFALLIYNGETGPTAEFSGSPTSGNVPLSVDFSDLSSGSATMWDWTFGDGGTSMDQNPTHEYTIPGVYTVSLTVTSPGGMDTETKVGYITATEPPPVADFEASPTTGWAPLSVDFTDLSTGSITSHDWDFGDGDDSTLQDPTHVYTDPGVYTVELTVTGPGGSDTRTEVALIRVKEVPGPFLTPPRERP